MAKNVFICGSGGKVKNILLHTCRRRSVSLTVNLKYISENGAAVIAKFFGVTLILFNAIPNGELYWTIFMPLSCLFDFPSCVFKI